MPTSTETIALPSPAPGTHRTLCVHRYGDPDARPKAYFQAALHADEWPGLLVLQHLMALLEQALERKEISGEITLVPVANPIGLAQCINHHQVGRYDLAVGGNFNRGFPDLTAMILPRARELLGSDPKHNIAQVRELLSSSVRELPRERETHALKANLLELSTPADWVFDLHCDGEALTHIYALEKQREAALELGLDLGAAVVLLEEEPGGQAFDQSNSGPWRRLSSELELGDALPLACFATTVELRGRADVDDDYARADAARLFQFLQRRGVVAGAHDFPKSEPPLVVPLDAVDILSAPEAGIIAYRKHIGDWVEADEVVAELVRLTGDGSSANRLAIRSQIRGLLFARSADKFARAGHNICKIAGETKLAHRQQGKLLED